MSSRTPRTSSSSRSTSDLATDSGPLMVSDVPAVWAKYRTAVMTDVRRYAGRCGTTAEDGIQTVAILFWQAVAAGRIVHRTGLRTWFRLTARNIVWTERRKTASSRFVFGAEDHLVETSRGPEDDQILRERAQLVRERGPAAMTGAQWAVVELHLGGAERAEIAQELGISGNAVGIRLHHGLAALRQAALRATHSRNREEEAHAHCRPGSVRKEFSVPSRAPRKAPCHKGST